MVPLGPAVLILKNDCAQALVGIQKGWYLLAMLQAASINVHKQCLRAGWIPMALHV